MALRALLFSADGDSTSTLCQVLTGLGIEAEICADLLVAVEHATKGGYDAIVVDWEQQDDTIFFLRALREVKPASVALSLALVRSESDVAGALQAGANSVIRKPINQRQAHDTLSTAKDLILSWHNEQTQKAARLAAIQDAAIQDAAPKFVPDESSGSEPAAPKSGFLSQSAPRSALEAEETAREQNPAVAEEPREEHKPEPLPQPAKESNRTASLLAWRQMQERKAAPVPPPAEKSQLVEPPPASEPRSQDATGVFSSYIEAQDTAATIIPASRRTFGIVTVTAALLVAGGLYAWAPGHPSTVRVLWRFHSMITGETGTATTAPAAVPPTDPAAKQSPHAEAKPADLAAADPFAGIVSDTNANNVHVIETKTIPVAGAQQPPSPDPSPFIAQGQTPPRPVESPDAPVPAVDVPQPEPAPSESPVPPQLPQADTSTPAAVNPVPSQPAENPSPGDGRTGVVIPDSLRTSPPPAPASSLEPVLVPEETSRGLVLRSVDPVYPPQAIQQRMEGPVVLQAWVGKDGTIRDVKLVRGYFVLGRAAVDAVKQWRFKPYSLNGKSATDFQTYITVNFKLPS